MLDIRLPYPPSINHYYVRTRSGGVCIGPAGKRFIAQVCAAMRADQYWKSTGALHGPLFLEVIVSPPDNRRRDLDNVQKALQDALQRAGAFEDDCQIKEYHVRWAPGPYTRPGWAQAKITQMKAENSSNRKESLNA